MLHSPGSAFPRRGLSQESFHAGVFDVVLNLFFRASFPVDPCPAIKHTLNPRGYWYLRPPRINALFTKAAAHLWPKAPLSRSTIVLGLARIGAESVLARKPEKKS
jgi:hypothetical protein